MYGYVYKTTCLTNGKWYIGIKHSPTFIPKYFGSGKLLKAAVRKYGEDNFTVQILEECADCDSLTAAEVRWIRESDAVTDENAYNLSAGGQSILHELSTREKMRSKRKPKTDEQKRRYSEAARRRYQDPKQRELTSELNRRRWSLPENRQIQSERTKAALSSPSIRQTLSEHSKAMWADPIYKAETSDKIKKALNRPETREKLSRAAKARAAKKLSSDQLTLGSVAEHF